MTLTLIHPTRTVVLCGVRGALVPSLSTDHVDVSIPPDDQSALLVHHNDHSVLLGGV